MRISHQGVLINGIQSVQISSEFQNSIAILDSDMTWIHIPDSVLHQLIIEYQKLNVPTTSISSSAVSVADLHPVKTTTEFKIDNDNPFII